MEAVRGQAGATGKIAGAGERGDKAAIKKRFKVRQGLVARRGAGYFQRGLPRRNHGGRAGRFWARGGLFPRAA